MLAELAGGDGQMPAESAAQALGTAEAETLCHGIDLFVAVGQCLARGVDAGCCHEGCRRHAGLVMETAREMPWAHGDAGGQCLDIEQLL